MMKSKRVIWVDLVARLAGKRNADTVLVGKSEEQFCYIACVRDKGERGDTGGIVVCALADSSRSNDVIYRLPIALQ
jgi:hypothetical protein